MIRHGKYENFSAIDTKNFTVNFDFQNLDFRGQSSFFSLRKTISNRAYLIKNKTEIF